MKNRGPALGGSVYSGLRKLLPAYLAEAPSSSSIRSIWLYLASRSLRHGAPVLIYTTTQLHIGTTTTTTTTTTTKLLLLCTGHFYR